LGSRVNSGSYSRIESRRHRIAEQEPERARFVPSVDCRRETRGNQEMNSMIRIGYAPGAFDLFHIGHLNLLRRPNDHCDVVIAGVVADDVLFRHKGVTPVIPLPERLDIVRNLRFVDRVHAATTDDKIEIWKGLRFTLLFKGDDWRGTEKGGKLERDFATVGVDLVYLPYTRATSSSALRPTLRDIDAIANPPAAPPPP